jgi:hypothetical protein
MAKADVKPKAAPASPAQLKAEAVLADKNQETAAFAVAVAAIAAKAKGLTGHEMANELRTIAQRLDDESRGVRA